MKKFTFTILIFFVTAGFSGLFAQKKENKSAPIQRCFTMEYLEKLIKEDPTLPAKWKAQGELIQQENAKKNTGNKILNTESITVIPIVFHLVMDAGQQATVTDAVVQRQVDILNRDFAGRNPDSTKLPPAFKALFGHSQIQFCLAKRTPTNLATNGIERRVTNAVFSSNTVSDLKKTVTGGLDQWDGSKYFNVWAANFSGGLLGIATFPFSASLDEQGVSISWGAMDLPCGPYAGLYDAGRTLVHETGHYFYLWHSWGDDNGTCSGDDFRIQNGFPLSASCTDDTPNQTNSTNGCLSGVQTDACSPSTPGYMYQNYMDYTNDACYGMFTLAQNCRMESCLNDYRADLKTSNGCTPIVAINNDVRVSEILNPTSRGFACAAKTTYCSSPLTPQVMIVNDADAPLTSVKFTIKVDGNIITTQNWAGNLMPGDFAYVNIAAFDPPVGVHTLQISTSEPNGGVDQNPGNDFLNAKYEVLSAAIVLPMPAESFEGVFPPAGWQINNPDGSFTWVKTNLAGNPGNASVGLNCYNYDNFPQNDFLITPKIKTSGVDSLIVKFNVAYAKYSDDIESWDELELVYSDDCGLSWKPAGYDKRGDELATNGGGFVDVSFVPTPGQWREETVKLALCNVNSSEIFFAFKSTNRYGNNIFLDNVSIDKIDILDPNAGITNLIVPKGILCDENYAPQLTLNNYGEKSLTSISFNISVDGSTASVFNWTGNIPRCGSATIALPSLTASTGTHSFLIYTTKPNGMADQVTANDTLKSFFSIAGKVNAPLAEGFENNVFPPQNFVLYNADNNITWKRNGNVSQSGAASAFMQNFIYLANNSADDLVSPTITVTDADSAFVSFDYAYAPGSNYPGSTTLPLDTLEVLVSKDCGISYTSLWKKWGEGLQTVNAPNYPNTKEFIPGSKDLWRHIRLFIPSNVVFGNDQFQVFFRAKSSQQNNLYLDNINIYGVTLPQRLKEQGYLIYPNPFSHSFLIHHYAAPTGLKSVQVFSSVGELVWDKRFSGNANTEITVNLNNLSRGVYILKMIYTNKTIVERVVKD